MGSATESYRMDARAKLGAHYSGALHFAFTSAACLAAIALLLARVRAPSFRDWLAVPVTFLYANLVEYFGHRYVMHRRRPALGLVYERHTLMHHRFFTAEQMQLASARDLKFVLFPPVLILFFFGLFALPSALLVARLFSANTAALFAATAIGYFLCYEWLHLSYHLPVAATRHIPALKFLRKHHAWHHSPEAMCVANFNITFPICDALFGTARTPPQGGSR